MPSPKPFRVPNCMCLRGPRTWSLSSRPKRSTNTSFPSFSLASLGGGRSRKSCQPPTRPSCCLNPEGGGVKRRCWRSRRRSSWSSGSKRLRKKSPLPLGYPNPKGAPELKEDLQIRKQQSYRSSLRKVGHSRQEVSKAKVSFANDKSALWLRDARKAASAWEK